MPFQFSSTAPYQFKEGDIFLGVDDQGREIGIETERHALCIAGAGSGKGAAIIIPNLLRWPHAVVQIDPKGENAERTYEAREAMGQAVGVLDPFHAADIPARLRVSINVLSGIDPKSRLSRGDVETIADGLVKRSDPKHAEWDDGAAALLAGVIAFMLDEAPKRGLEMEPSLPLIRQVLLQDRDALYADAQRMLDCESCGGLAKAAGATIMTALESEKGLERDFLGGARRHSAWLDDPAIADVLATSTFDLARLKDGKATLFLVLPPHYIESKAAFLRLFVRSSLNAMAAGGSGKGGRCLFLLDEFFALGRLDIVAKAAGLMRSYGVSLFPFLQDLGQLQQLYTPTGAETFFGNADAHIFFGNSDLLTLKYISTRLGQNMPNDVRDAPPAALPRYYPKFILDRLAEKHENTMSQYQHDMRRVGQARMSPEAVAAMVGKGNKHTVAPAMIVFGKQGAVLKISLSPFFKPARAETPAADHVREAIMRLNPSNFKSSVQSAWDKRGQIGFHIKHLTTYATILSLLTVATIQILLGTPVLNKDYSWAVFSSFLLMATILFHVIRKLKRSGII